MISEKKGYVVWDLESTGLSAMYDGGRITCICAKDNAGNKFGLVQQDEESMILQFLAWLYDHDPRDTVLVTHNGKSFDAQFLYIRLAELQRKVTHFDQFKEYEHFDSFHEYKEKFKKWISLNNLAAELGVPCQKCGTGLQAIRWWRDGEWDKLKEYCERDVEVTEQVFLRWSEKFDSER